MPAQLPRSECANRVMSEWGNGRAKQASHRTHAQWRTALLATLRKPDIREMNLDLLWMEVRKKLTNDID